MVYNKSVKQDIWFHFTGEVAVWFRLNDVNGSR